MRQVKYLKISLGLLVWGMILSFALTSCNLESGQFGIGQKTPTATVASPTPKKSGTATSSGTPTTGSSCLPGAWQIDHESFIEYMTDTMAGVGEEGFTPLSSQGTLTLTAENKTLTLAAEDFAVTVGVNIGGKPNVTSNTITVQAEGSADYSATGTQINLTEITYEVESALESDARIFVLDFEDLLTLVNAYGFARETAFPLEAADFIYTCVGDVLTLEINLHAEMVFIRNE